MLYSFHKKITTQFMWFLFIQKWPQRIIFFSNIIWHIRKNITIFNVWNGIPSSNFFDTLYYLLGFWFFWFLKLPRGLYVVDLGYMNFGYHLLLYLQPSSCLWKCKGIDPFCLNGRRQWTTCVVSLETLFIVIVTMGDFVYWLYCLVGNSMFLNLMDCVLIGVLATSLSPKEVRM